MAEESKKRSVALMFLGGFIVLIILIVGLYLIKLFFFSPPLPLPAAAFSSRLEERRYYDDKLKKEIIYWVIATTNRSQDTFYDCRFDLVAKGTQDNYEGFFQDYTLRDCYQYSLVKDNYDCRLDNGWARYTRYSAARTLKKLPAGGATELAVARFYLDDQTRAGQSYLTKNTLSDIYNYHISCRTSSGRAVTHDQLFL